MIGKISVSKGLRTVAVLEGAKGAFVLLAGFELLTFIHKDLHHAAVRLVEHLHLNPARHYPRIFLDLSERITDGQLWALAAAALFYAIVRFIEATGLWLEKKWAEWFAVMTGGIYIPIELYEITRGASWPKVSLFAINIAVVTYLLYALNKRGGVWKN
ncbi:MAG: DUF2127 domain-containing protein [Geobacteraceae bacterium]|nr:DUF2127 domain-containing protein [Geobacteraceae bacterium]